MNKKSIFKKWYFWVLVILLVLAVGAGISSLNEDLPTSGDVEPNVKDNGGITVTSKKAYSVGEVYKDKNITIKYLALDENFKGYNKYATVKDGYKVIKASFEFENTSSSDFLASSYSFDCYADGYDCESFWSTENSSFSSTLSTGKKAKGDVYFEVPLNASQITLEYEIDMWTDYRVIFTVK